MIIKANLFDWHMGRDRGMRAAQYVRMSTEHQKYSTDNQSAVIAEYAARRGMTIVRTYADEGRSGLKIDGRGALQRLIEDAQAGQADFEIILVYDVSRWGRFQDADESAYYEYVCKRAGISVRYCAEPFENDGDITSTVLKSIKRAMAGEYSRELSVKVFNGQCRLIELGFRQGGMAGYGLRRGLVDERGEWKGELEAGQYKSLQTDRVILVPGPSEEVSNVRYIYQAFVAEGQSEYEIANALNTEGKVTDLKRPWTRGLVHQILINPKYTGDNVFNRVSFKLKRRRVRNPPDMWIRNEGAFEAIIPRELFMRAAEIIACRSKRMTDAEMLGRLSVLLGEKGDLSGLVIDETEGMPSSSAYRSRFGSLLRAYSLIGYAPARDYRYLEINRALRCFHPDVVAGIVTNIKAVGGQVSINPENDILTVNDEFTLSVIIVRSFSLGGSSLRWKIRFDTSLRPDITVAVRMDAENHAILDYYLLPRIDMVTSPFSLKEENGVRWDTYRFETLDRLFLLAARSNIRSAA